MWTVFCFQVIDVADGGGSGNLMETSLPEDSEVICHTERPVPAQHVWIAMPTPEERLSSYRVVAILNRMLVVTHNSIPDVRFALKVYRKSSWPVLGVTSLDEPRPTPNMVRAASVLRFGNVV